MSYGYDRFLFLFINEVPVCYLSFRKDSLFLQETNRTANESSPYSRLASGPDLLLIRPPGRAFPFSRMAETADKTA